MAFYIHRLTSRYPLLLRPVLTGLVLALICSGCGRENRRFSSPSATFDTYCQALESRDFELLWSCYSETYRAQLPVDYPAWSQAWRQKTDPQLKAELRREIAAEETINDRIGFLLFDATTLESRQTSPFFYFIREADGWKITSHLDSLFHQELERAIERGEFVLPDG